MGRLLSIFGGALVSITTYQVIRTRIQADHQQIQLALDVMKNELDGHVIKNKRDTTVTGITDSLFGNALPSLKLSNHKINEAKEHWNSQIRWISSYLVGKY